MFTAYVVVAAVAGITNTFSATVDFIGYAPLRARMANAGVPPAWLPLLGALKLAGAFGVLVGIAVPPLGVAAAVGLILFFLGAIITLVRAQYRRRYFDRGDYLLTVGYLALATATLVLALAS
jgi:DoxX-like family